MKEWSAGVYENVGTFRNQEWRFKATSHHADKGTAVAAAIKLSNERWCTGGDFMRWLGGAGGPDGEIDWYGPDGRVRCRWTSGNVIWFTGRPSITSLES